jgi:hypothetical protein
LSRTIMNRPSETITRVQILCVAFVVVGDIAVDSFLVSANYEKISSH